MVMHRALFTWFIILVFLILLCLRLESRTHWSWFIIFLPLWLYDLILLVDALFSIIMNYRDESFKTIMKNKHNLIILVVLLKIAAQIIVCLKLEYEWLELSVYHVFAPIWLLLPILIINVSITLVRDSNY